MESYRLIVCILAKFRVHSAHKFCLLDTEWKPIRNALRSNFATPIIHSFIPLFEKHFTQFCDLLMDYMDGSTFDLYPIVINAAMNLVTETTMGTTVDQECKPKLFENYLDNVAARIIRFSLHPDIFFSCSKLCKETSDNYDKLYEVGRRILQSQNNNKDTSNRLFIDSILRHSEEYKDEKIRESVILENILTLLLAAFDTTALTISNTILLLAMHPEFDQKVAKELAENYKVDDEINPALLKRLPYLECVIKETLRLFPVVPGTLKTNMEDINLSTIGHVQKGTTFVINFFKLHRWKHIWGGDCDEFNPDRFLPENSTDRHPYAFLPFSTGPRNCLGSQYSMISLKTALLLILNRYKFTTELKMHDLKFKLSITMKMLTKHLVKISKRNQD